MRDAALKVERQALIRQTKRRSYDGLYAGSPSQGSSKRGSFSSRSSGGRGSSGDRRGADGSRFQRGGHTHGSGFQSVSSGSSHFSDICRPKKLPFDLWHLRQGTWWTMPMG